MVFKKLTSLMAVAFIFCFSFSLSAGSLPSAEELIQRSKLTSLNTSLTDYRCRMIADVKIKKFPYIRIKGVVYFKTPDKVKTELENIPSSLHIFPSALFYNEGFFDPKKKYLYKGPVLAKINNETCYHLTLIATNTENLKATHLWFDTKKNSLVRIVLEYKDGGKITIKRKYNSIGKLYLPVKQEGIFDTPKLKGEAIVYYLNYQVNCGLSDDIFKN